jgi:ribosomal protein S18 acetylase RimI-like enzyme
MRYMTSEVTLNRAIKNGIDFESSVGVYDGGTMVGFTLIGIDYWNGVSSAFDIATGLVKPYRGKGIATGMLEYATSRLKAQGVKRFQLEVLQDNEAAVKAYKKAGFRVTREFDCLELDLNRAVFVKDINERIVIQSVPRDRLVEFSASLDWRPSWENSLASIERIRDDVWIYAAQLDGDAAGILAYYPTLNWVLNMVVHRGYRLQGIGTGLIEYLVERLWGQVPKVKMINVLSSDNAMLRFAGSIGFEVYAKQYEMECFL